MPTGTSGSRSESRAGCRSSPSERACRHARIRAPSAHLAGALLLTQPSRQGRTRTQAKAIVDVVQVAGNRARADLELLCDLGVGQAASDQPCDLQLARA